MRESARPTGVCIGRILATPISSNGVSAGACVAFARKQATCGSPIPTTTVSPSFSSRAPAAAMISVARICISVAESPFCLQRGEPLHVSGLGEPRPVIFAAEDVFVDVLGDPNRVARVLDIELQMG